MSEEKLEEKVKPIRVECEAGKEYSFCTCGRSGNLPFCDNTHKKINSQQGTEYKSLKFCPENDTVVYVRCSNWKKGSDNK